MSLLGVDIGLSGCRVLAIGNDGRPLAQARASYALAHLDHGDLTLDPRALWDAAKGAILDVAQRTHSDRPLAICFASTVAPIVPLARDGGTLSHALLSRAPLKDEDAKGGFGGLAGDEVIHLLGGRPAKASPLRALSHWRRERPAVYAPMWRAVPLATWLALRLGGACVVDPSMAAGMQMLDVATNEWSGKVLHAARVAESKLPEIMAASAPIGTVPLPVAGTLGLDGDTRIVLGGADYACAALGMGAVHAGTGLLSLDRVISLLAAYEAPPLVGLLYARGLDAVPHVVVNRWLSQVMTPAGGNVLRWLRDVWMAHEARDAALHGYDFYRRLMDEMPDDPTSMVAFPPLESVFSGRGDRSRPGGMWGFTTSSTRGEVVKAFLEGALLACMDGVDSLRQAGIGLDVLRGTGPGARSAPWLQLAADVLDLVVEETGVLYPAPLGAAMLAGIGAGVFSNERDAIDTCVRPQRRYEPRPSQVDAYLVLRQRYQALGDLVAGIEDDG